MNEYEHDNIDLNDNSFSKKERLHHQKIIEELFKDGSSTFLYPFLLKYLPLQETEQERFHQLLISVPKKHIRRAPDRNLVKRRIREIYRTNKRLVYPSSVKYYLAVVYVGKEVAKFDFMRNKLIKVLKRLPISK